MQVTKEQIKQAKQKSLYDYMLTNYPGYVRQEGHSLKLLSNCSVSIKDNYFTDFGGSGNKGDNITFLKTYLGLSFQDAVIALIECKGGNILSGHNEKQRKFKLPQKATCQPERIINYLYCERSIKKSLSRWLIDNKLLYQDIYSNCVFVNPSEDFYEVRGTYNKPFHGSNYSSHNNSSYWYFYNPDATERPHKAYITESSIDAISLYLLRYEPAYYCAIAGVNNQARIDAIKKTGLECITAFDNDLAGKIARERNSDLNFIVPDEGYKDWNELLRNRISS